MKFIKKPLVIEAIQFDGKNTKKILKFTINAELIEGILGIHIKSGLMQVKKGDWIINNHNGISNESYVYDNETFKKLYSKYN